MSRQRVDLHPVTGQPTVSRPLPTGRLFLLVLPDVRLTSAAWDRDSYAPGDDATLIVRGRKLPDGLTLTVEVEDERQPGLFHPVATLPADPRSDRAEARVPWRFPPPPPPGPIAGHLVSAAWGASLLEPGEPVALQVAAQGLEGEGLDFLVEEERDDGAWTQVAHVASAVERGRAEVRWTPRTSASREDHGELLSCAFEDDGLRDTAWMTAQTRELDGTALQFVLEREEPDGSFIPIGAAAGTVREGRARASVLLAAEAR